MRERVARLEQAIMEAVKLASPALQQVIKLDLQALRGIADISAVTIASELGQVSRFESAPCQLMGYCGVVPSEDSSGKRTRRRKHHCKNRQRAPATHRCRSRMELSSSAMGIMVQDCTKDDKKSISEEAKRDCVERRNTGCISGI